MNLLDLGVVAGAWVLFMVFWQTRTLRTVAFLVAMTVVYLGAGNLLNPWRVLIRASLVPVAVGVVMRYPRLIWSMDQDEVAYDEFIHELAERLHRLNQPIVFDRAVWERYTDEYRATVRQLEERPIPHPEWVGLRDRFLDQIRFNLDVFEGRRPADVHSRDEAATNWNAVREEWKRVRRSRSSFWR